MPPKAARAVVATLTRKPSPSSLPQPTSTAPTPPPPAAAPTAAAPTAAAGATEAVVLPPQQEEDLLTKYARKLQDQQELYAALQRQGGEAQESSSSSSSQPSHQQPQENPLQTTLPLPSPSKRPKHKPRSKKPAATDSTTTTTTPGPQAAPLLSTNAIITIRDRLRTSTFLSIPDVRDLDKQIVNGALDAGSSDPRFCEQVLAIDAVVRLEPGLKARHASLLKEDVAMASEVRLNQWVDVVAGIETAKVKLGGILGEMRRDALLKGVESSGGAGAVGAVDDWRCLGGDTKGGTAAPMDPKIWGRVMRTVVADYETAKVGRQQLAVVAGAANAPTHKQVAARKFFEQMIVTQLAAPAQAERFCEILLQPGVYETVSAVLPVLRADRTNTKHADNPLITQIWKTTEHLRPASVNQKRAKLESDSKPSVQPTNKPGLAPQPSAPVSKEQASTPHTSAPVFKEPGAKSIDHYRFGGEHGHPEGLILKSKADRLISVEELAAKAPEEAVAIVRAHSPVSSSFLAFRLFTHWREGSCRGGLNFRWFMERKKRIQDLRSLPVKKPCSNPQTIPDLKYGLSVLWKEHSTAKQQRLRVVEEEDYNKNWTRPTLPPDRELMTEDIIECVHDTHHFPGTSIERGRMVRGKSSLPSINLNQPFMMPDQRRQIIDAVNALPIESLAEAIELIAAHAPDLMDQIEEGQLTFDGDEINDETAFQLLVIVKRSQGVELNEQETAVADKLKDVKL